MLRLSATMLALFALGESVAFACPVCSSPTGIAVRAGLLDGHFMQQLARVALPVPLLLLAVGAVGRGAPGDASSARETWMIARESIRPLVTAGTFLGIGLGGFVDGILFHQILQLHNMLSNRVLRDSLVNEQINMFWDGLFHAFTWCCVAVGVWLLWRAVKQPGVILSGRALGGAILLGWGLFNLIEGIVDHELLQLHHVVQNGNHLLWDVVFLCFGAGCIALGAWNVRAGFLQDAERSMR